MRSASCGPRPRGRRQSQCFGCWHITGVVVMGKVGEILDRGKLRITAAQYRGSFGSGTRFGLKPSAIALLAPLLPLVWFAIAYLVIRPLAAGPVVDSWIYRRAVKNLAAGMLALPGFTAAMPVPDRLRSAVVTAIRLELPGAGSISSAAGPGGRDALLSAGPALQRGSDRCDGRNRAAGHQSVLTYPEAFPS